MVNVPFYILHINLFVYLILKVTTYDLTTGDECTHIEI